MKISQTPLDGLLVLESSAFIDERGAFLRCYCQAELASVIGGRQIVQINHSRTEMVGAIRGLHFQYSPFAEMKLVRCLKGRVWDVAIDLRRGSQTFLRWHAEELSPINRKLLVIPEGFAHGFQVLEPSSELLYLHTQFYQPSSEGAVRFDDPKAGVQWPLPPCDLSPRDQVHPWLDESFSGITL